MKSKKYTIAAIILINFSSDSDDSGAMKLPEEVQNSFKKMFPDEQIKEWKLKKKKMLYEIEFLKGAEKYEAYFSQDGKWIRTEREIKKTDLPEAVLEGLKKSDFSDWQIDEVEEHLLPENKLVYEIEVEHEEQEYDLYFESDGTLLGTMSKR